MFRDALVEILTTRPLFPEVKFVHQKNRPGYRLLCALADVIKVHFQNDLDDYENSCFTNAKSTAVVVTKNPPEDPVRLKERFRITFYEHFLNDRAQDTDIQQTKNRAKTLYLFARSLLDANTQSTWLSWSQTWDFLPPITMDGTHKRLVMVQNVISFLFGGYGPTLWPTDVVVENPQSWIRTLNETYTAKLYLLDRAYGRRVTETESTVRHLIRKLEPKTFSAFLNKVCSNLNKL
jgi:hypothetical protein